MLSATRYNVSTKIPLALLVEAYEIWSTTGLSMRQVAVALDVDRSTLQQAINRAETKGLHGGYLRLTTGQMVLDAVQRNTSLTTAEIASYTGLTLAVVRHATYRLYERKQIQRRKLPSPGRGHIYY